MTDSRPIRLSEPTVTLGKYYAPFIIVFVSTGWYLTNKDTLLIPVLLLLGGLLYWFFRLLPLKDIKLHDNHLIISNDFTKDKVHLNDLDSLTTGGWSLYLTRIHFKRKTKFGQTIVFPTMQQGLGIGISDRVKNILEQIQGHIDIQKK